MRRGVVFVLIGERDRAFLLNSLRILHSFGEPLEITVYHDIDVPDIASQFPTVNLKKFERIKYPVREGNRNSSLFRLIALKESTADVTVYLDNDIYIVHRGFFEGFNIAYHYGISMVQNPRMFVSTYEGNLGDMDIGADVLDYDKAFCQHMPRYMTALNMGVTFYHRQSESFLDALIDEQTTHPSRGQAGLYRTIWKTKQSPYILPINWLVCERDAGLANPLSLHVGHKSILEWYERDFAT